MHKYLKFLLLKNYKKTLCKKIGFDEINHSETAETYKLLYFIFIIKYLSGQARHVIDACQCNPNEFLNATQRNQTMDAESK